MKAAFVQFNPTIGDIRGNFSRIVAAYKRHLSKHPHLVVFPELALTGYPAKDLLMRSEFMDEVHRHLDRFLPQISTPMLMGTPYRRSQGGETFLQNAVVVFENHRMRQVIFKTLLPDNDIFDESRYFVPAEPNQNNVLTFGKWRVAVLICEDIWFLYRRKKQETIDPLSKAKADLLINPSASPFYRGKQALRERVLKEASRRADCPILYVNQVGATEHLIFDGRSCVVDPAGNISHQAKPFCEDTLVYEKRARGSHSGPRSLSTGPMELLQGALTLGIRDHFKKMGFRKALVGLSGGIDSSVTAALAVKALGPRNVSGISLPSTFSSKASVTDAGKLARCLGIEFHIIPIQDTLKSLLRNLSPLFKGKTSDTTEENLQARCRGTLLMAISNKFGHLLLSTGNKSELAVGYCTLYGDMNGSLSVLGDVYKSEVYELASYINEKKEVIPKAILSKPPSAELRPDQKDSDTLPAYEILDPLLKLYLEKHCSAAEIHSHLHLSMKLVKDIIKKIHASEYKRFQAPPVIKVSSKAFGEGRRIPLVKSFRHLY